MSGDFAAYGLTVTPANVLGLRRVIMAEAGELQAALNYCKGRYPAGMPVLGGDPVSPYAAAGFTECINTYLAQCQARIDELSLLGDDLAAAAREYGRSEFEITASFRPGTQHDLSPQLRARASTAGPLATYPDLLHPGGVS